MWYVLFVAVVNWCLGYGLAVYLGHGGFPRRRGRPAEPVDEPFDAPADSLPT